MNDRNVRALPGRYGIAMGLAATALVIAARAFPAPLESLYARGLYPPLARGMASLSALVPFSLAEGVFLLAGLTLVTAAPRGWRGMRRQGAGRGRCLAAALTRLAGSIGTWWFLFLLCWGLHYFRPGVLRPFGLPRQAPSAEIRDALAARVGERVDLVRSRIAEGEGGVAAAPVDLRDLDEHLMRAQAAVLAEAGLPTVERGRVKTFLASPLLLRWGVSGVYGPFTGEPNVVLPAPPALLPFTMAHERAHLSGFAREDAASFVALLTCWRSDRPEVRYAGWLALYLHLRREKDERADGVRRDIEAIARFHASHRGPEADLVWRGYGGYLRAHGVREGTASYGRVAELALRWLSEKGLPPEAAVATRSTPRGPFRPSSRRG